MSLVPAWKVPTLARGPGSLLSAPPHELSWAAVGVPRILSPRDEVDPEFATEEHERDIHITEKELNM